MKVLDPGHSYQLECLDTSRPPVWLPFVKKEKKGKDFVTVQHGTTNEEVLKVLIDRLQVLRQRLPSKETSIAITKCEEALMWLEKRTKDRKERGVEGTYKE